MPFKKDIQQERQTSNEHFLIRNRNLRNELLRETDYLVLMDYYEKLTPEQQQDIKNYRQTLRDFINENKTNYLDEGIRFIDFPPPPKWIGTLNLPKF